MAIKKTRSSFPSTAGNGIDVSYMIWEDDSVKKPKAVIQLTHGWAEYGERYDELATFLAENGFVVAAQDHLGHGRTCGFRRLGLYPPKAGKYMVEDMHVLYEIMRAKYKKIPYMLYGHSLGSMMARTYIQKYSKDLAAAAISGTIYCPWCGFLLNPILYRVGSLLSPSYKKSGEKYDKRNEKKTEEFGTHKPNIAERLINSWLSYDQDNIYNYVNDPYIGISVTPTMLYLLPAFMNAGKLGAVRRVSKDLPIFVFSGADDMAGFFGFAAKNLHKQYVKKGRKSALKVYGHGKHEIHNEAHLKDEVFSDLLDFFNGAL